MKSRDNECGLNTRCVDLSRSNGKIQRNRFPDPGSMCVRCMIEWTPKVFDRSNSRITPHFFAVLRWNVCRLRLPSFLPFLSEKGKFNEAAEEYLRTHTSGADAK